MASRLVVARRVRLWAVRIGILALAVTALLIVVPRAWSHALLLSGLGLPERSGPPLAIIAHRGHLEQFPENTLEAIVAAVDAGADGVEFDVHQSADGTWWVIHDPTVDRTTSGTGAIHGLPDAVLDTLSITGGLGYDPERHFEIQLPRLVDVLASIQQYKGALYFDVQHSVGADVAELAKLVEGRNSHIICRSHACLRTVKEASPEVRTLIRLEAGGPTDFLDGWLAEAVREAHASTVRRSALPLTTFLDAHRYGNDEFPALRRAWAIGVEAFLTKDLEAALTARDDLASHSE